MQELIIVNKEDEILGYGEKMQIHREAILHRAFSIFIVNHHGEVMLQRRSSEKYHSGGLWANTCCSHPLKGEDINQAIHRRLMEEMGFDCPLTYLFKFIYKAELDQGMTEYELDHVYLGYYGAPPSPCPSEVSAWQWMHIEKLKRNLATNPHQYAYWLRHAFPNFHQHYRRLCSASLTPDL